MAYKRFQLTSIPDRDGVVVGYYWVDDLCGRISRWSWPTKADAIQALRDGIEWESS